MTMRKQQIKYQVYCELLDDSITEIIPIDYFFCQN